MTPAHVTRTAPARAGTSARLWRVALRLAGSGLLLATAWIHDHLYRNGYATVPAIGPLFRLDAVLAAAAAVAVLLAPPRLLALVAAAGALLQLGTLAALVQSLTVGAFGFTETLDAPLIPQTFVVEGLGAVALVVLALLARHDRGRGARRR